MNPTDRRYSREHEWAKPSSDGRTVTVGISDFAQESLGDVVFVSLPKVGEVLDQFKKLGEVESVKAVSDIYSPVTGTVMAVNDEVVNKPELLNEDPYDKAWLLKVSVADAKQLEKLMSAKDYDAFLQAEGHAGGH